MSAPSQSIPRRPPRKGTKSCTECRRRKVACSWSSEHASSCRRCEERASECIPQVFASPSTSTRQSNTRDRVRRLEQHVANLTEAVHSLESKLGYQNTRPKASPIIVQDDASGSDAGSDNESHVSDVPAIQPPPYLDSLFDNDFISYNHNTDNAQEPRSHKALTHVSDIARAALQPLIPPRDNICAFSGHASEWLQLVRIIFPLNWVNKSGDDILSQYEDMKQPSIDPNRLASWLLSVALTVAQMPRQAAGPRFTSKWPNNVSRFSAAIVEAVERVIIAQERLSGTVQGVETTILLIRLHCARGNFLKAWLQLRRVLAFAELLGLHRAVDGHKAALWECLCSMERLIFMMFAFPATTRHNRRKLNPDATNVKAPLPPYISRLSYIAIELEDINDAQARDLSDPELYEKVSKLDANLRELASSAPEWWSEHQQLSVPALLMQHIHYYITMRVHLPLSLRPVASPQTIYSRGACTEACSGLIRRYITLCSFLPAGFFVWQLLDLQVFTSVVILLLIDFSSASAGPSTLPSDSISPRAKSLAEEVVEAMESVADQSNSNYAKQAIPTIRTLVELLNKNDPTCTDARFSVKVPLLGKVHVRRKYQGAPRGAGTDQNISSTLAQSVGESTMTDPLPPSRLLSQDPASWGLPSWSIEEDSERVFYEAIMEDWSVHDWNGSPAFDFN